RAVGHEGALPATVEVNRVGEHHPGDRRDRAFRYDVLNPVFGLLGNPVVDFTSCFFWRIDEIGQLESRAVILLNLGVVGLAERVTLLTPQRIGNTQRPRGLS